MLDEVVFWEGWENAQDSKETTALDVCVGMKDAALRFKYGEKEHYPPLSGCGSYLLSVWICPEQTGQSYFEVHEGRSGRHFVLASGLEGISWLMYYTWRKCGQYQKALKRKLSKLVQPKEVSARAYVLCAGLRYLQVEGYARVEITVHPIDSLLHPRAMNQKTW